MNESATSRRSFLGTSLYGGQGEERGDHVNWKVAWTGSPKPGRSFVDLGHSRGELLVKMARTHGI